MFFQFLRNHPCHFPWFVDFHSQDSSNKSQISYPHLYVPTLRSCVAWIYVLSSSFWPRRVSIKRGTTSRLSPVIRCLLSTTPIDIPGQNDPKRLPMLKMLGLNWLNVCVCCVCLDWRLNVMTFEQTTRRNGAHSAADELMRRDSPKALWQRKSGNMSKWVKSQNMSNRHRNDSLTLGLRCCQVRRSPSQANQMLCGQWNQVKLKM